MHDEDFLWVLKSLACAIELKFLQAVGTVDWGS